MSLLAKEEGCHIQSESRQGEDGSSVSQQKLFVSYGVLKMSHRSAGCAVVTKVIM